MKQLSTISRKLGKVINEGVVTSANPNTPTDPVLYIKTGPVKATADPADKTTVPGIWIMSSSKGAANTLDEKQIEIVKQYCPQAVLKGKSGEMVALRLKAEDMDSPEVQSVISKLAEGLSACRVFGKITPDMIMDEMGFENKNQASPEVYHNMDRMELANFQRYIEKFNDPEIQKELAKIHVFTPFKGLSLQLSYRNIALIDAQNKTRQKPATYILSPSDWLHHFNRKVNRDAEPIYYWAPHQYGVDESEILKAQSQVFAGMDDAQISKMMNHFDPRRLVSFTAQKNAQSRPKGYLLWPYYDIADTTLIAGAEDLWSDEKRIGVVNNIHLEPTKASSGDIEANDKERAEAMQNLKNMMDGDNASAIDDKDYTLKVFFAVQELMPAKLRIKNKSLIMSDTGEPNMDSIKQFIFDGIKTLAMEKLNAYAKESNREPKAEMVACIIVSEFHVSSELALQKYSNMMSQNGAIGTLPDGKVVDLVKGQDGKYYYHDKKNLGRLINYNGPVEEVKFSDVLFEAANTLRNTVREIISNIESKLKKLESGYDSTPTGKLLFKHKTKRLAEAYLRNGVYEYEDHDREVLSFYNDLCNHAGSEDGDWFTQEYSSDMIDNEKNNQDLNDFYGQDSSLDFDDTLSDQRNLAEGKFYEMINRINKLY